jgi:hypothetical protein
MSVVLRPRLEVAMEVTAPVAVAYRREFWMPEMVRAEVEAIAE